MAVAMRGRVAQLRRGLAPPGPRPRLRRRASRRATRRSVGSASRDAPTTRRSAASRTSPPGSAARREPGQILISQRVYAAAEDIVVADSVGELALRGFSRPDARLQRGRTRRGAGAELTELAESAPRLSELERATSAARASRGCRSASCRSGTAMRLNQPGESIVVVPSVTPDATQGGARVQALEERMLFLLLLLRQPRLQVIYVTGRPVPESIVDYYLGAAAGRDPAPRPRAGCTWSPTHDGSARPLAAKLLERPRVLAQIRALIPDPARCHLVPYTTTTLERDLALALGIPLYGADPRLLAVRDEDRLPAAVRRGRRPAPARPRGPARRRRRRGRRSPRCARPRPRDARGDRQAQRRRLRAGATRSSTCATCRRPAPPTSGPSSAGASRRWRSSTRDITLEGYLAQLARDGGIVEERIIGAELRSPSVQLRVTPLGEVELLSTHDQLLGGPSGQSYLGCRFPADFGYAQAISREAAKIGAALARRGRARPLRRRLRRRPRRAAARGRRTRSRSTCARAARRTRS